MLHITVSVQHKVATVGIWTGCVRGGPALFYSALLLFGSRDRFAAQTGVGGEEGPAEATADGGDLMLSEEALRSGRTFAHPLPDRR